MRFRATLELRGKTATGFVVPPEVVEALGGGKRPAVTVTVGGFTYRSTIAAMGGEYLLPVSGERRESAGLAAGDQVDVDVELDTAPRVVEVPAELQSALDAEPAAAQAFSALSYSHQLAHVLAVESAKTAETRARRVAKVVETLGS